MKSRSRSKNKRTTARPNDRTKGGSVGRGLRKELALILGELGRVLAAVPHAAIEDLCRRILGAERVFLAGEGRSGLVAKAFAQRLVHLGLQVHVADEVTVPAIRSKDLMIACSGSGETRTTLERLLAAHEVGAYGVLVTANPEARLAEAADLVVHLPARPGASRGASRQAGLPAVASAQAGRSLFEQTMLVVFDAIALRLRKRLRVDFREMERRHSNLE